MVKLYEYQGKELLSRFGVMVPKGGVASSPEEARLLAESIGGPVVVKAQVLATGRMKSGGIAFATTPEEAEEAARKILGLKIKGLKVDKCRVEEKLDIASEYYAGFIVETSYKVKAPVALFSTEGGVEIEAVAAEHPEKVVSRVVDVFKGFSQEDALEMVRSLRVPGQVEGKVAYTIAKLYEAFKKYDARAAEINPMVVTKGGEVYAADCRISIDDASASRHPELGIKHPRESDVPLTRLEEIACEVQEGDYRGVLFFSQIAPEDEVRRGGYVGYHSIGGGAAFIGIDALQKVGLKAANYADTSGNPTAAKVYRCAKIILSQPGIEGYFLAGCAIASMDQWNTALGFVKAAREELRDRPGFPVVVLLAGSREREALEIVREGLKDLPIRLEVYGRDHVYRVYEVAERLRKLVEEYRMSRGGREKLTFEARTSRISIDLSRCEGCTTFDCVKADKLYGRGLLEVKDGRPQLTTQDPEEVKRLCVECLGCEVHCPRGAVRVEATVPGLDEYRREVA